MYFLFIVAAFLWIGNCHVFVSQKKNPIFFFFELRKPWTRSSMEWNRSTLVWYHVPLARRYSNPWFRIFRQGVNSLLKSDGGYGVKKQSCLPGSKRYCLRDYPIGKWPVCWTEIIKDRSFSLCDSISQSKDTERWDDQGKRPFALIL